MTTSAQVVEPSVNVTTDSPSQDYTHPDDHNLPTYDMTPEYKPFTVKMSRNMNLLKDARKHTLALLSGRQVRISHIHDI